MHGHPSLRSPTATTVTILTVVFLMAPLVVVVLFSFHSTAALTLPFKGFSLRWYREVLDSAEFRTSVLYSLRISLTAAATTLVLGTTTAYGLARTQSRLRGPLDFLFFLPFTLPGLFIGISLLVFFARVGLSLGSFTVLLGQLVYTLPFFLLICREAFVRIDPALEEVAADLGAGPVYAFRKVILPIIWPILAAGTLLSFALSFDEFPITFFTIGSRSTLPLFIFSRLRRAVDPTINVISTSLLVFTVALFGLAFLAIARSLRRQQETGAEP